MCETKEKFEKYLENFFSEELKNVSWHEWLDEPSPIEIIDFTFTPETIGGDELDELRGFE